MIRIQKEPGSYIYLNTAEAISHLAVVEITPDTRKVRVARDTTPELVCGVNMGTAVSGGLAHILIHGIASGVLCGGTVNLGDRLTVASGGYVASLNSITASGAISGYITGAISGYAPVNLLSGGIGSGWVTVGAGALTATSGPFTGVGGVQFSSGSLAGAFNSGRFAGGAWNTGRILGRALASGSLSQGIPVLVTLG